MALIGADGLWSTRGRTPAPASGRRLSRHRTAWRALVPAEQVSAQFRAPAVHLWLGHDAHLVHYPVKGGTLINIVAIVHDQWRDHRLVGGRRRAPRSCAISRAGPGASKRAR